MDFFWSAYANRYPQQTEKMEEAKLIIGESYGFFDSQAQDLTLPELAFGDSIREQFRDQQMSQANKVRHKHRTKFIRKAVVSSLLLLTVVLYVLFQSKSQPQIHYVTGHAEWKKVTLPDGSQVELNANTQLSLIEDWEEGVTRRVWLKGEAFFKVKKAPSTNTKFTVITKDLEVDVLGTTFNVNTRNDHTEVFLEEGKITLDMQGQLEQIEPGEFVSYSGTKKEVIDRYQKTEEIHSNWKDGVLKITDARMAEILSEVESIYGIDLIVKDKALLQKEGSVAIPVDDLDMATSILERVLNVKMTRKGKQIFVN